MKLSAGLCSFAEAQGHSGSQQSPDPCGCQSQVHISLLAVGQGLLSASRSPTGLFPSPLTSSISPVGAIFRVDPEADTPQPPQPPPQSSSFPSCQDRCHSLINDRPASSLVAPQHFHSGGYCLSPHLHVNSTRTGDFICFVPCCILNA